MPTGMILDANVLALWRFDEGKGATSFANAAGASYTLTGSGSGLKVVPSILGNAVHLNAPGDYLHCAGDATSDALWRAEHTIEFWCKPDWLYDQDTVNHGAILAMFAVTNDSNYVVFAEFSNNDGTVVFAYRDATPASQVVSSPAGKVAAGTRVHLGFRHRIVSTSHYLDLFVNGQQVVTGGPFPAPATKSGVAIHFGSNETNTSNGNWIGSIEEIRISKVARTDAEILASYQNGFAPVVTTASPTISNVSPAPGALDTTGTWSFDVTAPYNGMLESVVSVVLGGLADDEELVWNGGAFTLGYENSTRTAITNGYHYVIKRTAGWPAGSVEFSVQAFDKNGKVTPGTYSYTVTAPTGSTSPTLLRFPYSPAYSAQLDEKPRVRSAQFGDEYSQRTGDGIHPIQQKWSLKFSAQTKSDAEEILGFFRAHAGVTAFEFALPDGDWTVTGESFGTGDGVRRQWQLQRQTVHVTGIETMSGAFEDCSEFTSGPTVYVAGVPKVSGTDYTLSSSGLITFTSPPANGAALTFDGAGEDVRTVICQEWSDVLVNVGAFDLTATFQEVMG